jgi:hypothetical protein
MDQAEGAPFAGAMIGDTGTEAAMIRPMGGNGVMLAQAAYEPPPLPAGSRLSWAFLESPYTVMVVVLAGGLVAFAVQNRRGKSGAGLALLAGALSAAGGLWLLARLVVTPREEVGRATEALVQAAADVDMDALSGLLHPDVEAGAPTVGTISGRGNVLGTVQRVLWEQIPVESAAVLWKRASVEGDRATSQAKVRVRDQKYGSLTLSWWQIDWERSGDAWQARTIEALHLPGVSSRE